MDLALPQKITAKMLYRSTSFNISGDENFACHTKRADPELTPWRRASNERLWSRQSHFRRGTPTKIQDQPVPCTERSAIRFHHGSKWSYSIRLFCGTAMEINKRFSIVMENCKGVPSRNQTWLAGSHGQTKMSDFHRKASMKLGDFPMPCLIPRGYSSVQAF